MCFCYCFMSSFVVHVHQYSKMKGSSLRFVNMYNSWASVRIKRHHSSLPVQLFCNLTLCCHECIDHDSHSIGEGNWRQRILALWIPDINILESRTGALWKQVNWCSEQQGKMPREPVTLRTVQGRLGVMFLSDTTVNKHCKDHEYSAALSSLHWFTFFDCCGQLQCLPCTSWRFLFVWLFLQNTAGTQIASGPHSTAVGYVSVPSFHSVWLTPRGVTASGYGATALGTVSIWHSSC